MIVSRCCFCCFDGCLFTETFSLYTRGQAKLPPLTYPSNSQLVLCFVAKKNRFTAIDRLLNCGLHCKPTLLYEMFSCVYSPCVVKDSDYIAFKPGFQQQVTQRNATYRTVRNAETRQRRQVRQLVFDVKMRSRRTFQILLLLYFSRRIIRQRKKTKASFLDSGHFPKATTVGRNETVS